MSNNIIFQCEFEHIDGIPAFCMFLVKAQDRGPFLLLL